MLCNLITSDVGEVTGEKVARLCGDHLEHAYDALRLTTSGTTCISCCYHAVLPSTVICSTTSNSINCYDTAHGSLVSQHSKGPRRCSNAFNPSLSHVAVYGDPMAPAIELQLCSCNKFAFLEGPTAEGEQQHIRGMMRCDPCTVPLAAASSCCTMSCQYIARQIAAWQLSKRHVLVSRE
eukprot:GHRQ01027503.1.p1 GENE.GHRQ01027503.1~~GHRQ01027503.1.p1  ORF type:complete len:179 (-),score=49.36 GHRQ01027503.1:119-655(-)